MGGRVRRAGDHAVGQAEVHHHRAEVRDVRDDVARGLDRHALVGAQPRVFGGELLVKLGVERAQHLGCGDVDPQTARSGTDLLLVAEDRDVDDSAAQQCGRRLEDAVVAALGKHDARRHRARPLEQPVLEHERSDGRRLPCAEFAQ